MYKVKSTAGLMGAFLLIAAYIAPARPQETSPTPPSTKPIYKKSGLKLTVLNINVDNKKNIIVQIAANNETKDRIYLFLVGNYWGQLSSGDLFHLTRSVGIPFCSRCDYNRLQKDDVCNLQRCMDKESKDTKHYTHIEPDEFIPISVIFEPSDIGVKFTPGSVFSFAVKFIMREGPTESETLQAAADEKKITPAHSVMFNFPLIPLKTSEKE